MQDSGERKEFPGGGMRDASLGKERPELAWTADQPYEDQMITRYGHWMARGAEKYSSRNWEQFDSAEALEHAKGSLLRHTFKLLAGKTDEDHAAAVWFNVQAIELIRWKQRQEIEAEMMADAIYAATVDHPEARYFLEAAGSPILYYRWNGEDLTYAYASTAGRQTSAYKDPAALLGLEVGNITEIPVDDVPEWAR